MQYKLGLVGKTLVHSFSKIFFEEKFRNLNLSDFTYDLWELNDLENIREFIHQQKNVIGFNVTVPFKEKIINYLDVLNEDVKAIGACNCVQIKESKWIGYNTDWWGFLKMIENKIDKEYKSAMILGTGGSAKAVAYALEKLDIDYIYVSRNLNQLASKSFVSYKQLNQFYFKNYWLIINTTPLGMYPDTNSMPPIPIDFIDEKNFVIDIIYNPEKTLLLKEAEKRGAKILNGLEMLYLQAEKSWYIWQNINN